MNKRIEAAYEQRPRRWAFELAVAVVVVALLIWSGSAVETAGTTQSGAKIAWNILAGIFHPDTDLLFNFTTQGVPYLLLETICIAFLGTIVGAIISVPLAFLSASNLTPKPVAAAFNAMGLDYFTLGNHDFNFGYEALRDYLWAMDGVCLCTNVEDLGGELRIRPWAVHTLANGLRVGLTGVVTDFVNVWEQPQNLE